MRFLLIYFLNDSSRRVDYAELFLNEIQTYTRYGAIFSYFFFINNALVVFLVWVCVFVSVSVYMYKRR